MMECRIIRKPDGDYNEWVETLQPGDLVESPNAHPAVKDLWIFKCPVCNKPWTMDVKDRHRILSRDPLTVSPSWLCPSGCHYFIVNGLVQ